MRLRTMPLAILTLLTATGCVSVSGPPASPPAPSLAPAGDRSSAPLAPGQTSARQELGETAPEKSQQQTTDKGMGTGEQRPDQDPAPGTPDRTRPDGDRSAPVPPRRAGHPEFPGRRTPPKVRLPRTDRPGVRPPARPRPDYDMRKLCARSEGVADPSLTALCRDTYGR
ncbi:hypothetical protein [Streptomyces sp. NPDC002133]|uniref:hypothetical protein n=1 Tax=Streptomyces sp. NPDC002133 TaxID=3154409 RepID=UPI00331FF07C